MKSTISELREIREGNSGKKAGRRVRQILRRRLKQLDRHQLIAMITEALGDELEKVYPALEFATAGDGEASRRETAGIMAAEVDPLSEERLPDKEALAELFSAGQLHPVRLVKGGFRGCRMHPLDLGRGRPEKEAEEEFDLAYEQAA